MSVLIPRLLSSCEEECRNSHLCMLPFIVLWQTGGHFFFPSASAEARGIWQCKTPWTVARGTIGCKNLHPGESVLSLAGWHFHARCIGAHRKHDSSLAIWCGSQCKKYCLVVDEGLRMHRIGVGKQFFALRLQRTYWFRFCVIALSFFFPFLTKMWRGRFCAAAFLPTFPTTGSHCECAAWQLVLGIPSPVPRCLFLCSSLPGALLYWRWLENFAANCLHWSS